MQLYIFETYDERKFFHQEIFSDFKNDPLTFLKYVKSYKRRRPVSGLVHIRNNEDILAVITNEGVVHIPAGKTKTPLKDGSSQTELNCFEVSTQTRSEMKTAAAQTEVEAVGKVLTVQQPNATTAAQPDAKTGESSQGITIIVHMPAWKRSFNDNSKKK